MVPARQWRPGRRQPPRFLPSCSECAPVLAPESRVALGSVPKGSWHRVGRTPAQSFVPSGRLTSSLLRS